MLGILADCILLIRFEVIMARTPAFGDNRSFLRSWQCLLTATVVVGVSMPGMAADPLVEDQRRGVVELIDLDNGARDDPDIVRLRTALPRDWQGSRGPQPYNQVPPRAQQDFQRPAQPRALLTPPD